MSRVVVIGAGAVGLAAAREARLRGHEVVVIERGAAVRDGVSFGNAGIVVPSHFVPLAAPGVVATALRWMADPRSPLYLAPRPSPDLAAWGVRFVRAANAARAARAEPALLALNLAGRRLHEEWADALGRERVGFRASGLWMLCRTEPGLEAEARIAERARTLGLRAEIVGRDAVRAAEPEAAPDVVGAVRFPDDAQLDPGAWMYAMQEELAGDPGADLRFGLDAVALLRRRLDGARGISPVEAVAVRRAGDPGAPLETVTCDHLVLAGGAWSVPLARDLDLRILLEPGKGYALTLPKGVPSLRTPAILVEARASASRVRDGFRIGGTMEFAGFDPVVRPQRVEGIRAAARAYFPHLDDAVVDGAAPWSGFRPVSPDGLPYLGPAPRAPNAVVAAGHAMMGFSAAPISGRLAGQWIDGEPTELDATAFDPARHTWRR